MEVSSIVFADTRGKAIAGTLFSARDAGYKVEWKDVKAKRDCEFDCVASNYARYRPFNEEHIRKGMSYSAKIAPPEIGGSKPIEVSGLPSLPGRTEQTPAGAEGSAPVFSEGGTA